MNKIRYALTRFMTGRYGVDELYKGFECPMSRFDCRRRVFQVANFEHGPMDVHALVDLQVVFEKYRAKDNARTKNT